MYIMLCHFMFVQRFQPQDRRCLLSASASLYLPTYKHTYIHAYTHICCVLAVVTIQYGLVQSEDMLCVRWCLLQKTHISVTFYSSSSSTFVIILYQLLYCSLFCWSRSFACFGLRRNVINSTAIMSKLIPIKTTPNL